MSNRIDFFQSDQTQLSLPAATVSILVDGSLCSCLELVEIVRSAWPEFSWARLAYNPAAYAGGGVLSVEEVETELAIGKSVCIRQVYNGCAPGTGTFSFPIFDGQIEGIERRLGPNGESVEFVAKDFSANLKRINVYGQRVGNPDGSTVFLSGIDTVFNAEGEANAKTEPIENNGNS
jgi:hypothetical protein